jgi:Domain of unknown function (DUF4234)
MAAPEVSLKSAPGTKIKLRNPVTVLLLDLVTIGIYGLFWWYYANREMAELGRSKGTTELGQNPTNSVLALFPGGLIIVPAIITMINTGKRVKAAQRLSGQQEEANEWIGLLLMLVFAPVGLWYLQEQLNKVWAVEAEAPALEPGAAQPAQAPPPPPAGEPAQPAPPAGAPGSAPPPPGGEPGAPEGRPPGAPEGRPPGQP